MLLCCVRFYAFSLKKVLSSGPVHLRYIDVASARQKYGKKSGPSSLIKESFKEGNV